jgi:hypothetical protein
VDPLWLLAPPVAAAFAKVYWWDRRHPKVDPWIVARAWWETEIAPAAKLDRSELVSVREDKWSKHLHVRLRGGQTIEDVTPRLSNLASALNVGRRAVRVEEVKGGTARDVLLRVVEKDPHAEPIPWAGPSGESITRPRTIGIYETGEPTIISLLRVNTMLTGTRGSGKSVMENLLVGELVAAPDSRVYGIDFKGGAELKPWAGRLAAVATDEGEAVQLLQEVVAVMNQRLRSMASNGKRTWHPTPEHPQLTVVVDEQARVGKSKKLVELEDEIGTLGRAPAVSLVVAQQRATQDAIGSKLLRDLIDNNICLRVRNGAETDMALGDGARDDGYTPERLTLPGKFLLRVPDQWLTRPAPARAFWVSDARVRQLAAR